MHSTHSMGGKPGHSRTLMRLASGDTLNQCLPRLILHGRSYWTAEPGTCKKKTRPCQQTGRVSDWAEGESNPRHQDFQSCALPTELSARQTTEVTAKICFSRTIAYCLRGGSLRAFHSNRKATLLLPTKNEIGSKNNNQSNRLRCRDPQIQQQRLR